MKATPAPTCPKCGQPIAAERLTDLPSPELVKYLVEGDEHRRKYMRKYMKNYRANVLRQGKAKGSRK